jgi:hypothetical protein
MEELTEKQIRESFVNCSKEDASRLFVPSGLGFAPWDELDYFGWRDPSSPGKYHLVYWRGDEPVGIVLRRADQAKSVIVLKRSMNPGFAGIENELFYDPRTSMLFGDAKASLSKLVAEIKTL